MLGGKEGGDGSEQALGTVQCLASLSLEVRGSPGHTWLGS